MKLTKRIFACALAAMMLFSFVGCKKNVESTSSGEWITEKQYYYYDSEGNWTELTDDSLLYQLQDAEIVGGTEENGGSGTENNGGGSETVGTGNSDNDDNTDNSGNSGNTGNNGNNNTGNTGNTNTGNTGNIGNNTGNTGNTGNNTGNTNGNTGNNNTGNTNSGNNGNTGNNTGNIGDNGNTGNNNNQQGGNETPDAPIQVPVVDTQNFQSIVDYMGNDGFDLTHDHKNLVIESLHADVLEDDFRMRRDSYDEAYVTYKVDHVGEFIVQYSYGMSDRNAATPIFTVSKDGKVWTEVKAVYTAYSPFNGDSWVRHVAYFGGIDTDNQYVRITIPSGGKQVYDPNINFVQINGVTEEVLDEIGGYAPGISKAKTIYVDSENGRDTNSGTSQDQPLKSLYAASQKTYAPGSEILLKAGCSFSGSLNIKGSGNLIKPILVSSYGNGEKPVVNARGGAAISATGEYINITGLKITNKMGSQGINFTVSKPGASRGIKVTNCEFEDINVNFTNTAHAACGVYFKATGRQPSWFDGIVVENNKFNHVARCGIVVTTDWCARVRSQEWGHKNDVDKGERYAIKNLVIRNNNMNEIGGDGIFITGCDGAMVEKNVISNSGLFKNMGEIHWASIWCHSCDDCIFQYNEVYGNSGKNAGYDLQAFDSDISNRDCIFQYNYSHDNDGGFMLLCSNDAVNPENGPATATTGTIVRYNLSVNDGAEGLSVIDITSSIYDSQIYNNTIYCGKNNVKLVNFANYDGGSDQSKNTVFKNNIFYAKKGVNVTFGIKKLESASFDNNVFYNIEPPVSALIKVGKVLKDDPKFVSVGATGTGLKAMAEKYALKSGSYAWTSGVAIKNNGGIDMLGNKVKDNLMGAIAK